VHCASERSSEAGSAHCFLKSSMPRSKADLSDLLAGVERRSDRQGARDLQEQRLALLDAWALDPWAWLSGKDTDGRPILWTKDEFDRSAPLKPFPSHLRYLREFVRVLESEPRVLVDKARQMYVSTTVLLFNDWDSAFHPAVNTVLSKTKQEESIALLKDKVRFPFSRLPEWVQQARPIRKTPAKRIDYPRTESSTLGAAENMAVGEARGRTASRAIVDEAAYQETFEEMLQALDPMAAQIIAVSSPNLGCRGAEVFYQLLEREAA
jgi:hypothetical protein